MGLSPAYHTGRLLINDNPNEGAFYRQRAHFTARGDTGSRHWRLIIGGATAWQSMSRNITERHGTLIICGLLDDD